MVSTAALEEKLRVAAGEKMERASDELRRGIEHDAPRDTGALSVAPVTETIIEERRIVSRVTVDRKSPSGFDVARAQEEGTGEYASPPRGRIYPKPPNKHLVFFWSKIGRVVFAKSVAGTPATHFFSENTAKWRDRLRELYR